MSLGRFASTHTVLAVKLHLLLSFEALCNQEPKHCSLMTDTQVQSSHSKGDSFWKGYSHVH